MPNEEDTVAPVEVEPATTWIADLDADGVYQGCRSIELSELQPDDLHLPEGCDLPPGKYRWDADRATFVPLPKGVDKQLATPDLVGAIAIGFVGAWKAGQPLPPETRRWLRWYFKSHDGISCATDPESKRAIRDFMGSVK